jgi:hypothetical protein
MAVTSGHLLQRGDGTYEVDLGRLPLPQDIYTANSGWIFRDESWVTFGFGNKKYGENALRTRLEIRMPLEAFNAMWKNTSEFFIKLKSSVTQNAYMQHAPSTDARSWPTDKEHVMVATVCVMMHGGTSAEMDFFEIPAPSILAAGRAGDLSSVQVRPVVRVALPTGILVQQLEECAKIDKEISAFFPS